MQVLRDLAIALSLANLCFFSVWSDLLPNPPRHYHFLAPPLPFPFIAIMLNVLGLAILFWGGVVFARRSRQTLTLNLARWAFLAVFAVTLSGLYQEAPARFRADSLAFIGETGSAVLGVMLAGIAVLVLTRWWRQVIYAATTLVLVLFPFVLVTFSRAGWALIDRESAFAGFAQESLAPPLDVEGKPLPRVLWLIFDELDQRLTFLERPSTVKLPELDRFRGEALYASNAYPPAEETLLSMPALITGKLVSKAQQFRADELMITFADATDPVSWSAQPSIFSKTRDLGFNTAAVGWYHPYCRVLGHNLTSCDFYGGSEDKPELGMFETVSSQIVKSLQAVPLAEHLRLEQRAQGVLKSPSIAVRHREMAIERYLDMLEDAKKTVTNSDIGLTLLHWSIPHPPAIYNRVKKDLAWKGGRTYLDNLELTDRTLGELRSLMETAGIWQNTAVLITSDHGYRPNLWKKWMKSEESAAVNGKVDHRVPFLLKLAGQGTAVTYDPPFNTVLIHDIILALLHGEISDPNGLVTWLDQHRSIGQSPYGIRE